MSRAVPAAACLALVVAIATTASAPAQTAPPRELFVYGDSLAMFTAPFLPPALRGWRVEQDVLPNRRAAHAAAALRRRGPGVGPVVHLSLGTVDDPARPERFRAAVRRAMQAAGPRCVVWTNVYRPARRRSDPSWERLNAVLDEEAARRDNLVVVDWYSLVTRHRDWLDPRDHTHVDDRGSKARARAVARGVRECHRRLAVAERPPVAT
jgi:hypothetical protein